MLTRSGQVVLVGSILTVAAGWLLGLPELHVLGATGVVLVLFAAALVLRKPGIEVERILAPGRVHVGSTSRVEVRVGNGDRRATPVLFLHEPVEGTVGARISVAPLRRGGSSSATYQLPTERRGRLAVGPLVCTRTDPFGLARRSTTVAEMTHLTVLPAVHRLDGRPPSGGLQDPAGDHPRPAMGSRGIGDLSTLRPYVPGDDLRRVHWPTSARMGDLLIRVDDPPWQGHLTVVLDTAAERIDPEAFEGAVSAVASIVGAAATAGDRVRLLLGGDDTGLIDARASRDLLLGHLAVVERTDSDSLPDPLLDGARHTGGLIVVGGVIGPRHHIALAELTRTYSPVVAIAFHPSADPASPAVRQHLVSPESPFPTVWRPVATGRP